MPSGIYIRTKGLRNGNKNPMWNRPVSEGTREKQRNSRIGRKMSESSKEKLRLFNLGKKLSIDHKEKLHNSHLGQIPWNKGKKVLKMIGERHPRWKGGISKNFSHYARIRKVRRLGAAGSHTIAEWELLKKQYGFTCPCCGRSELTIRLTEDHIIPLTKGGSDFIENIQPLCKSCNCKKYNKIIPKYKLK